MLGQEINGLFLVTNPVETLLCNAAKDALNSCPYERFLGFKIERAYVRGQK